LAASATATRAPAPEGAGAAAFQHVFPLRDAGKVSYGRSHHDYPAADIFCPIGSQFVAVTDGIVDFVSRDDLWVAASDDPALRGGISVAIVGDDGVRYYGSHLSSVADGIEPGVRVHIGQLLGLTGKSGNAASTDPHLHFGISHPTTPDDWAVRRGEIQPYDYLRAWQRGENRTPTLP
jgi:murein DD-endopeptidase MepM/ murein hydrolase activator NlpD